MTARIFKERADNIEAPAAGRMRTHRTALQARACALLCLVPFSISADESSDPRGILRPRTARWHHEAPRVSGDAESGSEFNPTGNPIGGGSGYRDALAEPTYIANTRDELQSALKKSRSGDIVFLPGDTDIDLGGQPAITVPRGVTLASDRGRDGSQGARLYSTAPDTPAVVETGGAYARITGLRIEGPHKGRARIPKHSRGIQIGHFGCEVDNCEISSFSHAGVRVAEGATRAYIRHCYIHHNMRDGLGYGVVLGDGTALIEANRFDYGRHFTAATGRSGEGYEARYNVFGPHGTSHFIDMHGGRDRGDGTDIAGDWIHIHHNTFVGRKTIHIRGTPNQFRREHDNRIVPRWPVAGDRG